ncbi:MAG: hypothetical protein AAFQ02_10810 [Bacteroidota bacterium]
MKYISFLLTAFFLVLIMSCSSDDNGASDIDPIIGTWQGELTKAGLGINLTILTVNTLDIGQSGNRIMT